MLSRWLAVVFALVSFTVVRASDVDADICAKRTLAENLKARLTSKDQAVDVLMAAYASLAAGPEDGVAVVHILGEAGTGKTHVVREFAQAVLGDANLLLAHVGYDFHRQGHVGADELFGHAPEWIAHHAPLVQSLFPKGLLPLFVEKLGSRVGILNIDEAEKFGFQDALTQVLQHGTLGLHRNAPLFDLRPFKTGRLLVTMHWNARTTPWLDVPNRTTTVRLDTTAELRERVLLDALGGNGAFVLDVTPSALAKLSAAMTDLDFNARAAYHLGSELREALPRAHVDLVRGDKLYLRLRRADAPAVVEITVGATGRAVAIPLGAMLVDLCQRRHFGGLQAHAVAAAARY